MRITHLGHACLLVEIADARIMVDPGNFSDDPREVTGLDAIVVTHQHPDHLDRDRLPDLARANPDAVVLADSESVPILGDLGVMAQAISAAHRVGAATLTPHGRLHAVIHEELPRITNVGVRLDAEGEPSFYHPGDALDADFGEVDVLAFPLSAPWQASKEMTAFLRAHNAPYAVPIHDRILAPAGRELYLGHAARFGGADTEIRDLAGAGAVEFTA